MGATENLHHRSTLQDSDFLWSWDDQFVFSVIFIYVYAARDSRKRMEYWLGHRRKRLSFRDGWFWAAPILKIFREMEPSIWLKVFVGRYVHYLKSTNEIILNSNTRDGLLSEERKASGLFHYPGCGTAAAGGGKDGQLGCGPGYGHCSPENFPRRTFCIC